MRPSGRRRPAWNWSACFLDLASSRPALAGYMQAVRLIQERHHSVGNFVAVLNPVFLVLFGAAVVVTPLPVDSQNQQVEEIVVAQPRPLC